MKISSPVLISRTSTSRTRSRSAPTPTALPAPPRNGHRYHVLAYQRVSMHEDRTGGHTFETQSLRIGEKLDQLYGEDGYDLEMLTDNGISGAYGLTPTGRQKRTRPSLRAIADKLGSGLYDCFIVYSFSRLARSPGLMHHLLDEVIVPSGVDFISVTQDVNLGRADGRAMAGMLAVFDGFYRDSVVERNKDAAETRALAGFYVGQVGYGWRLEDLAQMLANGRRRIRPVPEQLKWVLQMKDWYLAGWSLPRIAGELNTLGVPSPSGRSRWTTAVVHRILHNPVHAGLVPLGRGGQQWLRGEHIEHRIYEDGVLEQLQAARDGRRRWKTNTLTTTTHLLNGLAFCERCDSRLYVSSANSIYRSYRCEKGVGQGHRTCPNLTVRADALEATVLRELERFAQDPAMRELLVREASGASDTQARKLQGEVAQLRERAHVLEARLERLVEALGDGTLSKDEFRGANAKLKGEREEIAERLQSSEAALENRQGHQEWVARVQAAVLDLPLVWEHLNGDERREVLSLVLEKLTVDRRGRDACVKIKVRLLPESEVPIMFKTTHQMKQKPTGVLALSQRHLAVLHHAGQGKTRAQIAQAMNINYGSATTLVSQIFKILEVRDLDQAVAMTRERVEALLPTLPLGAYRNDRSPRRSEEREVPVLSPALMEILPLLAQGATADEIARVTGLPATTVAGRRSRILDLLEVGTVYEAGQKARALGLLPGGAPATEPARSEAEPRLSMAATPPGTVTPAPGKGRKPRSSGEEAGSVLSETLPETLMVVLPLMVQGASTCHIAAQTGLPRSTVQGRCRRIHKLLDARSAYEVGQKARALGLLLEESSNMPT
jgi:site-specific DNA recombinase